MKLKLLSIFTLCATLMYSCSKEGEMGPQGPKGEQGIPGPQGISGKDGTVIYSGTTDPTSTLGNNGDFYLNLKAQTLFGPKTDGKWSENVSLKGKDGANGNDGTNGKDGQNGSNGKDGSNGSSGNTILSGFVQPGTGIGKLGDFYIDLGTMNFYGPKQSNSWGTAISLKPKAPLAKRILIKENFTYSKCSQCYSYSTTWLPGYSTLDATSVDELLNVGDIQEYYDKGTVTYEVRLNKGSWVPLEGKQVTWQPSSGSKNYYLMFSPSSIQYYRNSGKLFIGSSWSIEVKGSYSKEQLMAWMSNDIKVDIRITLLPGQEIEYISKAPKSTSPVKTQKI